MDEAAASVLVVTQTPTPSASSPILNCARKLAGDGSCRGAEGAADGC